ncbi:MAG: lipid-A-disaccharide synthase [Proteobacteria bacterium]|nr:lipid-A-disaccharide synthase [Pseudomonadota bacterium]
MQPEQMHICIIAGEMSGDYLGARLMEAIKKEHPGVLFSGIGGPQMEKEGQQSLFPMSDLSVMGLTEVLPRIPLLRRRIAQTARHIRERKPGMVITIDSPDFSFRVAKLARPFCAKMYHYVAPTVWAWRAGRATKVAKLYDGVICLFPFEPPWFELEGMRAAFVGHPVMESCIGKADGGKIRRELSIPADAKVLGLLFGSRMGELNRTGPVLREAAHRYAKDNPDIHILSLTLPDLEREARNLLQGFPCATHIVTDHARKAECFAAMSAALATSGTVGMELAAAGVPHAIGYRMNALTWQIVRRKLSVKHAHLMNILFESEVVPEFIQGRCRAGNILPALKTLMEDDVARARQRMMFDKFCEHISAPGGASSSDLAARFVLGAAASGITSACS